MGKEDEGYADVSYHYTECLVEERHVDLKWVEPGE